MDAQFEAEQILSDRHEKDLDVSESFRSLFGLFDLAWNVAEEMAPTPQTGDSDARYFRLAARCHLVVTAVLEAARDPESPWLFPEKDYCHEHQPRRKCYECGEQLPRGRRPRLFDECSEPSPEERDGREADKDG